MYLWLSNYLESLFISVDRNEVLGSRSMSLPTLSTMWWEQDYSRGEFEKSKFAVFHPESFDSKLNNYWIQSRKFGFGVNIKSRKKSSKSLMFPYNPVTSHTIPCDRPSTLYLLLSNNLEGFLISVDANEVLASRSMSLPTLSREAIWAGNLEFLRL